MAGALTAVLVGWFANPFAGDAGTKAAPPTRHVPSVFARVYRVGGLAEESQRLSAPIFWAGPTRGSIYEFRRTPEDAYYVRYLPRGLRAGANGRFLTVAAFPFRGAWAALVQ